MNHLYDEYNDFHQPLNRVLVFFLVYPDGREEMISKDVDAIDIRNKGIAKIKSRELSLDEVNC